MRWLEETEFGRRELSGFSDGVIAITRKAD
jgi:hypothetical protein